MKSSPSLLGLSGASVLALLAMCSPARADKPEGLSPQTLSMPNGPASLKGLGESFAPNIATGTGSYSVPISLPPGLLVPRVSLVYTGGKGKSEVGVGFRLPVLSIYRTTDKGLPRFEEGDRFAVEGPSLNDELVLVDADSGTYRLKNEGAFALFVRDAAGDSWTVRMPGGETAYLGESGDSRQGNTFGTYRWFIERSGDRVGHGVRYSYFVDERHLYLEEIRYQLHAGAAYRNSVVFEYEQRPDVYTDYTYGRAETVSKRLSAIHVYHGARLLRQYRLGYESGPIFSLLSQVEMEGEGGLSMPRLGFEYLEHIREHGGLTTMRWTPPLEYLVDGRAVLEDVNGDALPDILVGEAGNWRYYENVDGVTWSEQPIQVTGDPDRSLSWDNVLLADVNGDGFRDVVHVHDGAFRYYPGGRVRDGYFEGFGQPVTLRTNGTPGYHWGSPQVRLTDLNHDGRTDLLYQTPGGLQQVLNLEDDRLQESSLPDPPADVDFSDSNLHLVDFNGDGIFDFVKKDITPERGRVRVWFGLGWGRYAPEQRMLAVPRGAGHEFHLQDVNRDGQTDLVRVSGSWVAYYLNDGNMQYTGLMGDFYPMPPVYETRKLLFGDMNGNGTTDVIWLTTDGKFKYLDLLYQPYFGLLERIDNGMGKVVSLSYRSSTEYAVDAKRSGQQWETTLPVPVPVISGISVTDSFDIFGFEANESETVYIYHDGYYDGKEREFRGFGRVTAISAGDEFHPGQVTHTWMHVGRNLRTGEDEEVLKGKPYLQVVEDEQGAIFSSVESQWEQRWLCQEDLEGITETILPDCSRYPPRQENKDRLVAMALSTGTLSGAWERTVTPRYTYTRTEQDAWGNAVRAEAYGEVSFIGTHVPGEPFSLSDMDVLVGQDELVQESSFINNVGEWLIGFPLTQRALDLEGRVLSQTRSYYDGPDFEGLPLGQVFVGLPTRQDAWLSAEGQPERWIDVARHAYDIHGHVIASLDANDNRREIGYDEQTNTFPVTERVLVESGPLEYTAEYDKGLGSMVQATDFNGYTTSFWYDGLGRLERVVDPLGNYEQPLHRYSYVFGTPDNPISTTTVESLVDRDLGTLRTSYLYTDGLGRARLAKAEAEQPHGYIGTGWQRLSPRGSATHVWDSFFSSHAGLEAAPGFAPVTVIYYDALGRAEQVFPPATGDGPTYTLTEYFPFETRVYDERDTSEGTWLYPAISRVDGQGRVREIAKYNDYDGAFREFRWTVSYDALGAIVGIVDPQDNPKTYWYDSLQRMTALEDPNVGRVSYTYDDAGNLIERIDALGQRKLWEHGLGNRLLAEHRRDDARGKPDYSNFYHYDAPSDLLPDATNLLGKLSWVQWPHGSVHYSYDEQGRLVTEAQSVWDPSRSSEQNQQRDAFRRDYEYNAAGELIAETLPGGLDLAYQYNPRGLLTTVTGGFTGEPRQIFASGLEYDHRASLIRSNHGNNTSTCLWYDDRGRLAGFKSAIHSGDRCADPQATSSLAFQHLLYQRTPTGLISEVQDLSPERPDVPRFDASYEYDRLYELIEARTPQGTTTYSYDTIQNLVRRESTIENSRLILGEWRYGEDDAGPNQVTTAGDEHFTYDELGNMQGYNGFDLEFDIDGRLAKAWNSQGTIIRYYYDHTGARRLKLTYRPGEPLKINRYVFGAYQIRDEQETWFVEAGSSTAEISLSQGVAPSLYLLDELIHYQNDPENAGKPLPEEQLDLDGSGSFDRQDLEAAARSYWNGTNLGGTRMVVRYYHTDHLGGTTHVTDLTGALISHLKFHPYGLTAHQRGEQPVFGFTGAERDEEAELGLMRMGARYYAPNLGRWVSADRLFIDDASKCVENPMECGLYVYVKNSPLDFIDPSGMGGPAMSMSQFKDIAQAVDQLGSLNDYLNKNTDFSAPFSYTASEYAVAQPVEKVKTGNWFTDLAANTLAGFYNVATIPLNAASEASSLPKRGLMAIGMDEIDADATLTISGLFAWQYQLSRLSLGRSSSRQLVLGFSEDAGVPRGGTKVGDKVYRVWGGEAKAGGHSWTRVDPCTVGNYRDAAGLPRQNTGRFVSEGRLTSTEGVRTRGALELHGNKGGLDEVLVPDPSKQIRLERVSGVNPEY